jgi:hypothetical protein
VRRLDFKSNAALFHCEESIEPPRPDEDACAMTVQEQAIGGACKVRSAKSERFIGGEL